MAPAFSRLVQSPLLHILLALHLRLVPPRHVVQLVNKWPILHRHVLPRLVVQWASGLQQMTTQLVPSEIIATWTVPRGRVLYRPREEVLMLLLKVKYVLVLPAPMAAQFHQRENRRDHLPLQEEGLKCRSLQSQEQMF